MECYNNSGGRKLSQLPDFRSKALLKEAMDRGVVLVDGAITEGASVAVVGLADIVFEMKKDLAELLNRVYL